MFDEIDFLGVNTVRTLSIDAIQKANSGHPGLPMGAAPMAYVLWTKHLKVNPKTSLEWINRDRFILSAGHGSSLLYSLLHLSGYKVTINDLRHFRQWNSNTPGHPEVNHTDGVEVTTGPLGQGIAMAVGMAMAEAHLAAIYNKDLFNVVDHYTYSLCGDGDMMEGIAQEACSLAGHLQLGKLIVLYDSNDISLDGPTSKTFTENVGKRFEAIGWQHILVQDGNDLEAISQAINQAKAEHRKPTLIEIKTIIGFGSRNEGTSAVHGSPLGYDDIVQAKESYKWSYPEFTVPQEVKQRFKETLERNGERAESDWKKMFAEYEKEYPSLARQFQLAISDCLPENWDQDLPRYEVGTSKASRVCSKEIIQMLSKTMPSFWGGSADLASSNNTTIDGADDFQPGKYEGKNIWFGVREFAMAATMNGIQLHGGSRVYGGTFFVFVDYLRAAIRLSAIQKAPVTYVMTHDSIAVGEDGLTHEPIEQLASLRCIPNVQVIRPADGNETRAAWKIAITSKDRPTVLVLSRQSLPVIEGTQKYADEMLSKGAYVISKQKGNSPEGILIASGSEVSLAIKAQQELAHQGKDVSVVSIPSFDLFDIQSQDYKNSVLPPSVSKRLVVEAASAFGWEKYAGTSGAMVCINHFGASAPGDKLMTTFGFTVENVVNMYNSL